MRTEKNVTHLRIGELARAVGVEQFVIRFWEKEFGLSCKRSNGGQRFYSSTDVTTFKKIKELLYEKRYTIDGARTALKNNNSDNIVPSRRLSEATCAHTAMLEHLLLLRNQLVKLKELL